MTTHELPCFTSEIQIHLTPFWSREISMSPVKYQFRKVTVLPNFFLGAAHYQFHDYVPWGWAWGKHTIAITSLAGCAHLTQVWSFILKFTTSWRIRSVNLCLTQLFKLNLPNSRGKKRPFRPVWDSWIAVISFRDNLSVQNDSSPEKKTKKTHNTSPLQRSWIWNVSKDQKLF